MANGHGHWPWPMAMAMAGTPILLRGCCAVVARSAVWGSHRFSGPGLCAWGPQPQPLLTPLVRFASLRVVRGPQQQLAVPSGTQVVNNISVICVVNTVQTTTFDPIRHPSCEQNVGHLRCKYNANNNFRSHLAPNK